MQVSQHSVELKVQLLTGKEGVRVREVSGWFTESVPRIQTQNNTQKKLNSKEITEDFVGQLVHL